MDPFHTLRQRQDRTQRGAVVETVEDHVGIGSVLFQEIEIVSSEHGYGLREAIKEAQEGIVRAGNNEKGDGVHETRKITQAKPEAHSIIANIVAWRLPNSYGICPPWIKFLAHWITWKGVSLGG
jgi:hypothetical protein